MPRRSAPAQLFLCVLVVAASSSCKREARGFRVLPVAAQRTRRAENTTFHPGGDERPDLPSGTSIATPRDIDINAYDIAAGQQLFQAMNCAGCHASHGGGAIGPALTDQ